MTIKNEDPLLNNEDAAAYIGDNPGTLNNRRSHGAGPAYVKVGAKVRYRRSALDAYLSENTVETFAKGAGGAS